MIEFCLEYVGAKLLPSTADPPPSVHNNLQRTEKIPQILHESKIAREKDQIVRHQENRDSITLDKYVELYGCQFASMECVATRTSKDSSGGDSGMHGLPESAMWTPAGRKILSRYGGSTHPGGCHYGWGKLGVWCSGRDEWSSECHSSSRCSSEIHKTVL